MQNLNLICVIETVETYLGFWGERLNFGIVIAEIQPKVWERRRKRWREKILNFDNVDTEIPLSNFAAGCERCAWSAQSEKKKKIWQTNCGNAIAKIGKKNCNNCGNDIAKNGEKKKSGSEIWGE